MARNSLKNVMRMIESAKETLPVEQEFLADLKRTIELDDETARRTPSPTYKPSSLKCIRNMYYQVTGAPQDASGSNYVMVGICNSGTDTHVRIQHYVDVMKDHGIECYYIDVADFVKVRDLKDITVVSKVGAETKLRHESLNMSFMCDGIIRYKNRYYILEIKTETSYKWTTRKDVDPVHFAQATAYSIAFGLDDVLFVYISRDTVDLKAYMLHVTDEMKTELIGKIEECDEFVRRLKVPPIPDDVSKKTCEYCAYKEVCRKDG